MEHEQKRPMRHQESFLRVLSEMTFEGKMTTGISQAIVRRFRWIDISEYPPTINWRLMPNLNEPSAPDLTAVFGHVPILKEGEAPWWRYAVRHPLEDEDEWAEAKPAWWDDPKPEVLPLLLHYPFTLMY